MSPKRLFKRIVRSALVTWREQPTRYDIEAMQSNVDRVGLVIRMRWALVLALGVYSLVAAGIYSLEPHLRADMLANMPVPAAALVFVCLYNAFYQRTYRRFGNVAVMSHLQLLLDIAVVTVLVYFSGGVSSWFWTMYALFVMEATFILPRRRSAWALAAVCVLALAVLELGPMTGFVPRAHIPFDSPPNAYNATFVWVRFLWQVTVLCGAASVATVMSASWRAREARLESSMEVDEKTGLRDRACLTRSAQCELPKALKAGYPAHLVLIDIDNFGEINRRLGFQTGDRVLKMVSDVITLASREDGGLADTLCRYGGEEFALLIVGERADGTQPTHEQALRIARRIVDAIARARHDDIGVTVSVGVASLPGDGATLDELLVAADEALNDAVEAGGNRAEAFRGPRTTGDASDNGF